MNTPVAPLALSAVGPSFELLSALWTGARVADGSESTLTSTAVGDAVVAGEGGAAEPPPPIPAVLLLLVVLLQLPAPPSRSTPELLPVLTLLLGLHVGLWVTSLRPTAVGPTLPVTVGDGASDGVNVEPSGLLLLLLLLLLPAGVLLPLLLLTEGESLPTMATGAELEGTGIAAGEGVESTGEPPPPAPALPLLVVLLPPPLALALPPSRSAAELEPPFPELLLPVPPMPLSSVESP